MRLAQKAQSNYNPSDADPLDEGDTEVSRQTIDLFFTFLTSKTGLFLKEPLVNELAETIDGFASIGEKNLLRFSRGLIRPLPGGNGPVNSRRMEEVGSFLETLQNALVLEGNVAEAGKARAESLIAILREAAVIFADDKRRDEAMPILQEVTNVFQLVAVEVLEIRGSRAMRNILQLGPAKSSNYS